MDAHFVKLLRCPVSHQKLRVRKEANGEEVSLVSEDERHVYPVINGIPRFVEFHNYADNFGIQWNRFKKTQLDSFSGQSISADRFWEATGWTADELKGKFILDVGCGAGRFSEIALSAGARVVSLDYSTAIDACKENLGQSRNLFLVQADIYQLPFTPNSFDFVYCLGVLQHTPDVGTAFDALPKMVRPGGRLAADFYWKRFRTMMHSKYVFRPITKRLSQEHLLQVLEYLVPTLLRLSQMLGSIPLIGVAIKRILPVADYTGRLPLSPDQLKEWALLDTFDMLAPAYDSPQTASTVRKWFVKNGMESIEILHAGHLVGRGRKSK